MKSTWSGPVTLKIQFIPRGNTIPYRDFYKNKVTKIPFITCSDQNLNYQAVEY
jgi:hypothetical protein